MSRGLVNKSTGERIPSAPGYIVDKVGDLSALHTTAKDKAVSAINEVADAVSAIDDGASIDSFADVENALAGKQDTITAGDDLKFSGSTLNVEVSVPYIDEYDLSTDGNGWTVITKKHKGEVVSTNTYQSGTYATYDIDGCFTLTCTGGTPYWQVTLTKASTDDPAETTYGWGYGETPAVTNIQFELAETGTASEFITALGISVEGLASSKQPKTDNNLTTTSKEVTGAINEVKSGLIDVTGRARNNITANLSNLFTAISEQNLEKYGYNIGDYFIGNSGYKYYIADYDTLYSGYSGYGNTDIHHIGVVVDTGDTSAWLEEGTMTSYADSDLNTMLTSTVLNNIKSDMLLLFGGETGMEHLIGTRKLYSNLNGTPVWGWSSDSQQNYIYICAMTEMQIYGSKLLSVSNFEQGEGCKQLAIFKKYKWTEIYGDYNVWLRSIGSDTEACSADGRGNAAKHTATALARVSGLILFH